MKNFDTLEFEMPDNEVNRIFKFLWLFQIYITSVCLFGATL